MRWHILEVRLVTTCCRGHPVNFSDTGTPAQIVFRLCIASMPAQKLRLLPKTPHL
jgi:hypothetical protein